MKVLLVGDGDHIAAVMVPFLRAIGVRRRGARAEAFTAACPVHN